MENNVCLIMSTKQEHGAYNNIKKILNPKSIRTLHTETFMKYF